MEVKKKKREQKKLVERWASRWRACRFGSKIFFKDIFVFRSFFFVSILLRSGSPAASGFSKVSAASHPRNQKKKPKTKDGKKRGAKPLGRRWKEKEIQITKRCLKKKKQVKLGNIVWLQMASVKN